MSTDLSSLLTGALGRKFYWGRLRKSFDSSDTPDAVTETKYSLISSFTFLLYDHGEIGVPNPNHLEISQYLPNSDHFRCWSKLSYTKPGILFWSAIFMVGHESLEAFMVTCQGPLLMGQSTVPLN